MGARGRVVIVLHAAIGVWVGCSHTAAGDSADAAGDIAAGGAGMFEGGGGAGGTGDDGGSARGDAVDAFPVTAAFELPRKIFTFDSASFGGAAPGVPTVACGGSNLVQDCCNPPAPSPKPDCTAHPFVCETGVCAVKLSVSATQTIDLQMEVPVLSTFGPQSLADLSLTMLSYHVESTLDVAVSAVDLYLAPAAVSDPMDARATKLGTVPAINGSSADGAVVPAPNAGTTFSSYGRALGTPFHVIATTTVTLPSGAIAPAGKMTLTISGAASASLPSSP